ncbi:hypothetical protein L1887_11148 [Cichorium endivia]|nr:hypothetical protein L1887_11148 [Cichorium endivia]
MEDKKFFGNSARVYAGGAHGAAGLVSTVGSEVFEELGRSLVHRTLDYLGIGPVMPFAQLLASAAKLTKVEADIMQEKFIFQEPNKIS